MESMAKNKINVLNRFFSRNTFRHVLNSGNDEVYTSVVRRYVFDYNKSNKELISEIYAELKNHYRNEYFYKNTLLNKLLLGVHSVNTTTALSEVPIEKSKADFVLINGKAVVYEIKTELDNFDRLESQVNDYYKAFDHVTVITSENNLENLERIVNDLNKPVGICVLQRNTKIKTVCKPGRYTCDLDKETFFKILRKNEYEDILLRYYNELPDTSQFKYYKECKKLFLEIPQDIAYLEFIRALKQRTVIIKEEFDKVPYELKFLAYFMGLQEEDYRSLEMFLNSEFGGV